MYDMVWSVYRPQPWGCVIIFTPQGTLTSQIWGQLGRCNGIRVHPYEKKYISIHPLTTWAPPPLPAPVPRTPAPWARVAPCLQTTPTRLVFDIIASTSGSNTNPQPSPLPLPRVSVTPSPIAHRTRSHLAPPPHSSLEALIQYHIPTAKTTRSQHTLVIQFAGLCQALVLLEPELTEFACLCARLTSPDKGHSLAVLDKESSQ